MTAFICQLCGQWIGTEYKGNCNYSLHKCDPIQIKIFEEGRKELEALDQEYWRKKHEIESRIIKPSY